MAWGESLIWTSSAFKRMALPGWVIKPQSVSYACLIQSSLWLTHKEKIGCSFNPLSQLLCLILVHSWPNYFDCFCFSLHAVCASCSSTFLKFITESTSRLTKRWIKVRSEPCMVEACVVFLFLSVFFYPYARTPHPPLPHYLPCQCCSSSVILCTAQLYLTYLVFFHPPVWLQALIDLRSVKTFIFLEAVLKILFFMTKK